MENFKVKVPGINFELSSNQIYHIREVSDTDAPDGFQKAGISKHPLPNISMGIIVPHDGTNWNTGLNQKSLCYRKEKQASKIMGTLNKHLIPELQELIEGDIKSIKKENDKLFDEFTPFNGEGYGEDTSKFKIKNGNMFDTRNPLEFLALWFALLSKQLMPPEEANAGYYKNCSFVLEDKKQTTHSEQENEYSKMDAVSRVMEILRSKNDKEIKHLGRLFEYVGLKVDLSETDMKPAISIFSKWADKGGYNNENAKEFNEVYEKFSEENAREELIAYSTLLKHIKSSKVKIERKDIILDGVNLGSDKKAAARKIVADQELHQKFLELE